MAIRRILRRQGDILLKPIEQIPTTVIKIEGDIVAHGENGNTHKAKGGLVQLYRKDRRFDLFADKLARPDQIDYVQVFEDAKMDHQEHNKGTWGKIKHLLPKGIYAVVHEREYNPFALEGDKIRQVLD